MTERQMIIKNNSEKFYRDLRSCTKFMVMAAYTDFYIETKQLYVIAAAKKGKVSYYVEKIKDYGKTMIIL